MLDDFLFIILAKPQLDKSIGEKRLRTTAEEMLSVKELNRYNSKRQEFEIEYDNDAEHDGAVQMETLCRILEETYGVKYMKKYLEGHQNTKNKCMHIGIS